MSLILRHVLTQNSTEKPGSYIAFSRRFLYSRVPYWFPEDRHHLHKAIANDFSLGVDTAISNTNLCNLQLIRHTILLDVERETRLGVSTSSSYFNVRKSSFWALGSELPQLTGSNQIFINNFTFCWIYGLNQYK